MNKKYVVIVIERYSNKIMKRIDCLSENKAQKIDIGLNIILNHYKYFTVIEYPTKEGAGDD